MAGTLIRCVPSNRWPARWSIRNQASHLHRISDRFPIRSKKGYGRQKMKENIMEENVELADGNFQCVVQLVEDVATEAAMKAALIASAIVLENFAQMIEKATIAGSAAAREGAEQMRDAVIAQAREFSAALRDRIPSRSTVESAT